MWASALFLFAALTILLLCILQDRELDEELKYLLRYRHIQEDYRRTRTNIN
ncbi:MAG: hypothetical protein HYZ23_03025 [Chloroflexi bacterium]|nr:hypothetical protein [Chloroflexota bacterium]